MLIDPLNQLFVTAEYIEEKYLGIEHNDTLIVTASLTVEGSKKKPGIAVKTKPDLWSRCKSEAKSRMGGKHSARAMQLALKLYKQRGGGFRGPKPTAKTNKMKKWTKQKWMYLSDFKKKKKKDKNKSEDFIGLYNNAAKNHTHHSKKLSSEELEMYLGILGSHVRDAGIESIQPKDQTEAAIWEASYEASLNDEKVKLKNWLLELAKHYDLDVEEITRDGAQAGFASKADSNNATGRYLPEDKWESLSPKEREATDRKKRKAKEQYVDNTDKAKVKSKFKYYSK